MTTALDAVIARLGAGSPAAALAALEAAAVTDDRSARLLAVARPTLERRAGVRRGPSGGEEALLARFEERLAEIVAGMEEARAAGDHERAETLHARYIELGTSYAARLTRG